MKKAHRTISIVGISLMCIPVLSISSYFFQAARTWKIGFTIVSFLIACLFVSFEITDTIKLNCMKKSGHHFELTVNRIEPVKLVHVRGFYTFRLIAEYEDQEKICHRIHTPVYSVLKFGSNLSQNGVSIDNVHAKLYVKNGKSCIEVICI